MDAFSFSTVSSDYNSPDHQSSETEVLMLASQNPKKRAGRKKFKETRHPVYRGVRSRNSGKQWVCEVRQPNNNSRMWLGTHATPEMAARAHDVAVLAMRGRSACLNFADSVWRLPVPESNSMSDIQKAAAMFKHTEEMEKELPELAFEEEMMGTPEFMESMAEALMVPPPRTVSLWRICRYGAFSGFSLSFCFK